MTHNVKTNRLGRKPSHRKALVRNMVTSLFRSERIVTTKPKAQAVRRVAEKMITRAKEDSVHNRREIFKDIKDNAILAKLFTQIAPVFVDRNGGYTRILKIGQRQGDATELVLLELVEKTPELLATQERREKAAEKRASKAASQAPKA